MVKRLRVVCACRIRQRCVVVGVGVVVVILVVDGDSGVWRVAVGRCCGGELRQTRRVGLRQNWTRSLR